MFANVDAKTSLTNIVHMREDERKHLDRHPTSPLATTQRQRQTGISHAAIDRYLILCEAGD
jgi:hypothetical protein